MPAVFSFRMQVNIVVVGMPTLKRTQTHIQAQDRHIPAVVPLKHKQERVHTHCGTFHGGCCSVAHMSRWPLFLWVREPW